MSPHLSSVALLRAGALKGCDAEYWSESFCFLDKKKQKRKKEAYSGVLRTQNRERKSASSRDLCRGASGRSSFLLLSVIACGAHRPMCILFYAPLAGHVGSNLHPLPRAMAHSLRLQHTHVPVRNLLRSCVRRVRSGEQRLRRIKQRICVTGSVRKHLNTFRHASGWLGFGKREQCAPVECATVPGSRACAVVCLGFVSRSWLI